MLFGLAGAAWGAPPEVGPVVTVRAWRELSARAPEELAAQCRQPWVPIDDLPVACADLWEVARALNALSVKAGYTPVYTFADVDIAFDPTADGWRLPTCGEAIALFGVESGGRSAMVSTRGSVAWCSSERQTPRRLDGNGRVSVWRNERGEDGENVASVRTLDPVWRSANTQILPVRTRPDADPPLTLSPGPLPAPSAWRWGSTLVSGAELDAATWRALGGPARTAVDGACVPGSDPDEMPARCVTPREAIDVLNAMSARDGLWPVYTRAGDDVEVDLTANGWRLPFGGEITPLLAPVTAPCPAGANLGGDLPIEARVSNASGGYGPEVTCTGDGSVGIAPTTADDGRYGNVAELAWVLGRDGDPAHPVRYGPTWTWAVFATGVARVGLDDAAPDVGLRPIRSLSPAPPEGYLTIGVGLAGLVGLFARGKRGAVASLGATIVAIGVWRAWSAWDAAPHFVAVDLPIEGFQTVTRYDVVATDAGTLRSATFAEACWGDTHLRPWSCSDWKVTWQSTGAADDDGCYAEATATTAAWIIAPRAFLPPDDAALAVQWRDKLAALLSIEEGHRLHGVRAAEQIPAEIRKLPPQPTCEAALAAADARAAEVVATFRRADARYRARAETAATDRSLDARTAPAGKRPSEDKKKRSRL